jgi:phosphoglycerol transferase MdoB-like AlkP superfamily enzyme
MKELFKFDKLKVVVSALLFGLIAGLSLYSFIQKELSIGQLVLCLFLLLTVCCFFYIDYRFHKSASLVLFALLPMLSFFLLEWISHNPFKMEVQIMVLNIIIYYLLFGFLCFAIGNTRIAGMIGTSIPLLIGAVNYFVVSFRSVPIMPWDILSFKTAVSVADQYQFVFNYRFLIVVICFLYLIFIAEKAEVKIKKVPIRIVSAVVSLVLIFGYVTYVKTDKAKADFSLDDILFTPNVLYRNNGFVVAFTMNLQYLEIKRPNQYSTENIEKLQEEIKANRENEKKVTASPNIIVIMNEAYADLAVNGEFETNEDYMPFVRSMEENTLKGNAYVSIKGGNTANSEFEFLTNSSMAFLPVGSVAYQQYIHDQTPNLAGQLGALGYRTIAMHPYNASGWNRDEVYDYFGFDEMYFAPDFKEAERIRNYISDRATFEKIIERYEDKQEDESLFVFDVTMQNHGSYTKEYEDFTNSILMPNASGSTYTEQYLSLIKETDVAFEELIRYFEAQEEDTIILMFGDHQPADYVIKPIYGENGITDDITFEQEQKRYIVPYIMWSNYDIPEQEIGDISLNYLNTVLLENAQLPLTDYQIYLKNLRKTLPVITANIYKDQEGIMYSREDEKYSGLLDEYAGLQYNNIFDTKNRVDSFYQLPGR